MISLLWFTITDQSFSSVLEIEKTGNRISSMFTVSYLSPVLIYEYATFVQYRVNLLYTYSYIYCLRLEGCIYKCIWNVCNYIYTCTNKQVYNYAGSFIVWSIIHIYGICNYNWGKIFITFIDSPELEQWGFFKTDNLWKCRRTEYKSLTKTEMENVALESIF